MAKGINAGDAASASSSLMVGQSLFAESSLVHQGSETLKQLMADLNLDRVISEAQGTARLEIA